MTSSYSIDTLYSVKDTVSIVTGGGTGIGRAIATALAINGGTVIICGRRLNVVEATAAEINATASGKVIAIEADVSTKEGISAFYDKASQHIDRLDFLVANAGFSAGWRDHSSLANVETLEKKLWSVEDSDFEKMTSIHVSGPYFLSVKFIPLFKKAANPSVCLITSMASFFLNRAVCELSYAQSKAAETQMTQLLAATLSPLKIRVNSVVPGLFKSQLTTDANGELYGVMQDQVKNIPLERVGAPEEIAGPTIMLASPAGRFMNSANILVDGGWGINSSARDI